MAHMCGVCRVPSGAGIAFKRHYVGDQAGPGLLARVLTQYDDVALHPPAYFYPTVKEPKLNPDAQRFILGVHLFAGTWVQDMRGRYRKLWRKT